MSLSIPISGTAKLKVGYVDAQGNPTSAPASAGPLTWMVENSAVAVLDIATGPEVIVSPAPGSLGLATTVSVTDGTFTSDADSITVVAGPAVGIQILAE